MPDGVVERLADGAWLGVPEAVSVRVAEAVAVAERVPEAVRVRDIV